MINSVLLAEGDEITITYSPGSDEFALVDVNWKPVPAPQIIGAILIGNFASISARVSSDVAYHKHAPRAVWAASYFSRSGYTFEESTLLDSTPENDGYVVVCTYQGVAHNG